MYQIAFDNEGFFFFRKEYSEDYPNIIYVSRYDNDKYICHCWGTWEGINTPPRSRYWIKLHKLTGPARIFYGSLREEWFKNGRLHRDDGPAVTHTSGERVWYREGCWIKSENKTGFSVNTPV